MKRTPHLRWQARVSLCLFLALLAVFGAIWHTTVQVPRQDYADLSSEVDVVCSHVAVPSRPRGDLAEDVVTSHVHVSYVYITTPSPSPIDWTPLREAKEREWARAFPSTLQSVVRVTSDFQALYNPDSEVKARQHVRDSAREYIFTIHAPEGVSSSTVFECQSVRGWGGRCHATKGERPDGLDVLFRTMHTMVHRFLGWSEGVPPAEFLAEYQQLAAAEACASLRALFTTLNSLSSMPLPHEVHHVASHSSAELLRWKGLSGVAQAKAALRAQQLAHTAYYHPELIPATYHPFDHLVAIYLPLFFPLTLPVLIGLLSEVKLTKAERREKDK